MLPRDQKSSTGTGDNIETHLTTASRKLSQFINTILDTAMKHAGTVINGDMLQEAFGLQNDFNALNVRQLNEQLLRW